MNLKHRVTTWTKGLYAKLKNTYPKLTIRLLPIVKATENTPVTLDCIIVQTYTHIKNKPVHAVRQGKDSLYAIIPKDSELGTKKMVFIKRAVPQYPKGFFGGLAQKLMIVGFTDENVEKEVEN